MDSTTLLVIDEEPISSSQALKYLQAAGKLQSFIVEILRQKILEREIETNEALTLNPEVITQAIVDFRLDNQLTDGQSFQAWLTSNGLDYTAFYQQVSFGFKLQQLKFQVAEPKLQEFFIEQKLFLDRVVLSRITVAEKEVAEELKSQVLEGARFEALAQEFSLTDDRIMNGLMGAISRGQIPDSIRSLVDQAAPGDLIGPIQIENRYCLFRVEQFLPAALEGGLKQELQDQLFEQWLGEKMQKLTIQLQVNHDR